MAKKVSVRSKDYGHEEINAIALASYAVERVDGRARQRVMNWLVSKYLGPEALNAVDRVLPSDRALGTDDKEQV